jgi:uroporphyrinogen decarboxylase
LIPDALGADLWFVTGEGPRLSTITGPDGLKPLKGKDDIHDHLAPVYETVRILSATAQGNHADRLRRRALDRGHLHDRRARHARPGARPTSCGEEDPETFGALIDLLTEATIEYLDQQVQAGAEVVKIFDSWAGSLKGEAFTASRWNPPNGSRPS